MVGDRDGSVLTTAAMLLPEDKRVALAQQLVMSVEGRSSILPLIRLEHNTRTHWEYLEQRAKSAGIPV